MSRASVRSSFTLDISSEKLPAVRIISSSLRCPRTYIRRRLRDRANRRPS
ncbi:MAG: hypothetical protein IPH48_02485 [bacterium]|nr:hypothetical protein [bacterium]